MDIEDAAKNLGVILLIALVLYGVFMLGIAINVVNHHSDKQRGDPLVLQEMQELRETGR